MNPDDPVCLCFHVTRRKVINYIRVEKPKRPSQLSECFGAGTGCGWCRDYLARLLISELGQPADTQNAAGMPPAEPISAEPSFVEYSRQRANYVREGGGTPPPGAIPINDQQDPNP